MRHEDILQILSACFGKNSVTYPRKRKGTREEILNWESTAFHYLARPDYFLYDLDVSELPNQFDLEDYRAPKRRNEERRRRWNGAAGLPFSCIFYVYGRQSDDHHQEQKAYGRKRWPRLCFRLTTDMKGGKLSKQKYFTINCTAILHELRSHSSYTAVRFAINSTA
ncbi:unnamed protein product [Victoria cruziana]